MANSLKELYKKRRAILYENSKVKWISEDGIIEIPVSKEEFIVVKQIGKGTYGSVDKGKAPSGCFVALKRLFLENEKCNMGFPLTALREIKILSSFEHKNVVELLDVVTSDNSGEMEVYLVFEFLEHDLAGLINNQRVKFEEKHIKYYTSGIFEGLYYLHERCETIHRDIKSSNILIGNDGSVRLGDFGLARLKRKKGEAPYTRTVVTLWYRAPEILLGDRNYDQSIDVWSTGCIMAELYLGRPLFQGNTDAEQIDLICGLVGSPSESNFPKGLELPISPSRHYPRDFSKLKFIKSSSPLAFDLLGKILVLNPEKRLTVAQILDHDFFHVGITATPFNFTNTEPSHEFEVQQRHRKHRENKGIKAVLKQTDRSVFENKKSEWPKASKKIKSGRVSSDSVETDSTKTHCEKECEDLIESSTEISSSDEEAQTGSESGEVVIG